MVEVSGALETDDTGGIVLENLVHRGAEMVMERSALPDTDMLTAFLVELVHLRLYDDTDTLHEEDTAEEGDHELLMDDHGTDTDDTANGEAAGVTEEDLGREAIPPEIADEGSDERGEEDNDLFRTRDIHDIEILRPDDTTGGVGKDEQGNADDSRVAGTHAVHAVVEVSTIADGSHHEDSEEDEEDPAEAVTVLLAGPGEEVGVVEVMMLDEGDSGLGGFDLGGLLHDDDIILDMAGDDLVHADGRTETEREADDETQRDLSADLDPSVETVFVLAEGLDIVVGETECAHEKRGDEHQDHIDVRQFAEQQTRDEDGGDDDESAHGRHTFLGHIEGVDGGVTLGLGDVTALHEVDEGVAEPDADAEGDDARGDGAEGDVGEKPRSCEMPVRT